VRHHVFVSVPSNRKPWLDTGIDLVAGEKVTTIGSGQPSSPERRSTRISSFGAASALTAKPSAARARPTHSPLRRPADFMSRAISPENGRHGAGDPATPDEAYSGVTGDLACAGRSSRSTG
jgi:hypothetical protein